MNLDILKEKINFIVKKIKEFDYKEFMEKVNLEKYKYATYFILALIAIQFLFIIFFSVRLYLYKKELNEKLDSLQQLSTYKVQPDFDMKWEKIYDLVEKSLDIKTQKNNLDTVMLNLQSPYFWLLQNIYLPSLNVWKDPYGSWLNIDILWQDFLSKNPYIDINLLAKWWNFFKDVWEWLSSNEILNISIWDISETKDWMFSISINTSFSSPSRRSFLMLINKLSVTSNKRNVALINEFMYNIWDEIKIQNAEKFKQDKISDKDLNNYIWEKFYRWLKEDKQNDLINENIILEAMKKTWKCEAKDQNDKCLFKFRDKFSSIYSLAYNIWDINNSNRVQSLKLFLSNLPPLLDIDKFSFKKQTNELASLDNTRFLWDISIKIYWRSISNEELNQISKYLWESCVASWKSLSLDIALSRVNDKIKVVLWDKKDVNSDIFRDLTEIKKLIEASKKDYEWWFNYKKAIKLFEVYRVLNENNLCKDK